LAEANIHRQVASESWNELPGMDERPVMQDFLDLLTDMGQFPGNKTGAIAGS
jgi:hypothetical protein